MVSVLIPTYNYNFFPLVKEIHRQLINENLPFEIICIDDASDYKFKENDNLVHLENASYYMLEKNKGRSAIRNYLAQKAKFEWLLFLDVDVFPKESDFIKKYIYAIRNTANESVFCGGLAYDKISIDDNKYLRWNFGRNREQRELIFRLKKPYKTFFTSNFLINKQVFSKIKFNEEISLYGYEDVVFAIDLKREKVKINHIENLVYHLGLESNDEYLRKTKVALDNLKLLSDKNIIYCIDVKLLRAHENIKKFYFDYLLGKVYQFLGKYLEKYLIKGKSKLFIFDFFKITYLSYIYRN
ncbi:MAG: glycosyltransferase [Flavobacteriaceae bacterium]|nr:glycosyltransferase [Flavobacteriaceae bacterium]